MLYEAHHTDSKIVYRFTTCKLKINTILNLNSDNKILNIILNLRGIGCCLQWQYQCLTHNEFKKVFLLILVY